MKFEMITINAQGVKLGTKTAECSIGQLRLTAKACGYTFRKVPTVPMWIAVGNNTTMVIKEVI